MGLLSNMETRNRLLDLVVRKGNFLVVILFTTGAIGMGLITHPAFNSGVYISENALLPGLVKAKFTGSNLKKFYEDYNAELSKISKTSSEVPLSWLQKELTLIGLDVYRQNYSFTYPLNLLNNKTVTGENLYAVLRAPRSSNTESMVMTAPLRPPGSGLSGTSGSVALMLSLAKDMKKEVYWSKDVIFVFPQHEFVGMQAWLDGYLRLSSSDYIKAGDIEARGGIIQAALNLEFDDLTFGGINVLTEGINGILPNLDLVNLIYNLARERYITPLIHGREDFYSYDGAETMKHNIQTAFLMVCQQATGMASGNHGLFLRYRIDAVTVRGGPGREFSVRTAGELIEGVFRSINNLLEKFHQSFFFYLLPSTERFISIGVYIIPFALMGAACLIKAIALWGSFTADVSSRDKNIRENKDKAFTADGKLAEDTIRTLRLPDSVLEGIYHLLPVVIACQFGGFLLNKAPELFGSAELKQLPADQAAVLGTLACLVSCMILCRGIVRKEEFEEMNWKLLKSLALIYHGLILFSMALLNISLAVIITIFTVPIYSFVRPSHSSILTVLQSIVLLIASPLGIVIFTTVVHSHVTGREPIHTATFTDSVNNLYNSIMYLLIDHFVFKNFLFNLITIVLFPTWLLMWSIIWMNV